MRIRLRLRRRTERLRDMGILLLHLCIIYKHYALYKHLRIICAPYIRLPVNTNTKITNKVDILIFF